jgi:hypothetical protein
MLGFKRLIGIHSRVLYRSLWEPTSRLLAFTHAVTPVLNYMNHQFSIHKFCVLPTQCIYVFCVDLIINSDISLHNIKGFLGAFSKLQKAIISFVMSVRPFVHMKQLGSNWTDFHEI